MGAEQSAFLACTQTGKHEEPVKMSNSEKFFQLYFEKMPDPHTGPVTEALLHLISHMQQQNLEEQEKYTGYEHDEFDDGELDIDMMSEEEIAVDPLSDTDISIESSSTLYNLHNEDSDFEIIPLEFVDLQPIEYPNTEDLEIEWEQDFVINVADLSEE
ncbi:uncharacterized protein LOC6562774 [Drosophila grimshawi]|uniref:GH11343 n=1 Tax=Drosophila grimshawi TaxID=7222 RepID=B4JEB2_DROGR|nr:uncharacterized protein LOC6562774 [Drosophila grimshawi]EDW03632.1 GH11343 [Drosophila grimshawi]